MKKIFLTGLVLAGILFSGCSAKHSLVFNENFTPKDNTKIELKEVSNKTSQTFEVNAEQMLKEALSKKLETENMLWVNEESSKLQLYVDILEYSEGNAFKRWIMPGWGATVLSIEATLKDNNQIIGKANANRNIAAGGGYTIGAWKYVYDDIAADLISDLKEAHNKKN